MGFFTCCLGRHRRVVADQARGQLLEAADRVPTLIVRLVRVVHTDQDHRRFHDGMDLRVSSIGEESRGKNTRRCTFFIFKIM